ncbi:sporulation protein YtfJ [Virgibacillus subterraneus]|uniref:Sporulation protein YtfJ n=2 Tax=Virgibacillus TaxID=84406 RepID=A0A1H1ASS0_9BACI|nr:MULTISPECIES: GerW family sporulation protein [Virgibacillus]SDQ42778.1 sporulation protein YtfJ [Virgibacillus salinus]SEQ10378.1 sporulation protein YtfJ [Virgibacillus subterraneus]
MEEHPIQGLMTTAMENLKDMIEVNTIIGDPVESPDGSVIIPVSKVGFGFAAGGSEFSTGGSGQSKSDSSSGGSLPFGGGSGGGVSITPVAFLIVSPKGIKMVHLDENTHIYEKMLDFAPKAVEKIQQILKESAQSPKNKQKSGRDQQQSDKQNSNQQDGQRQQDQQQSEDQTRYDI